jgi:hypothetical protein
METKSALKTSTISANALDLTIEGLALTNTTKTLQMPTQLSKMISPSDQLGWIHFTTETNMLKGF